jgi:DNA-binding transcriptional ArsR family regulator
MKPLFHPALEAVTVEGILYALSDPIRVGIYINLARAECPQICASFREQAGGSLPKSTLSQHFRILREAGLIRSERKGVELHNVTRCAELRARFGELVPSIIAAYQQQGSVG